MVETNLEGKMNAGVLQLRSIPQDFAEYSLELSSYVAKDVTDILDRTYITPPIALAIREIEGRLSGGSNDGFFLLDSSFGSGKTHSLITIYEHFKERRVVAIDGHSIRDNLWTEISIQLSKKPLTQEEVISVLFEEPVLLLIDEIVVHLKKAKGQMVGDTNLADLTLAFLHTVLVEAKNHPAAVVITTPGTEGSYRAETESLVDQIKGIALRQSLIFEASTSKDLQSILSKQLFTRMDESPFNDRFVGFIADNLLPVQNFQSVRGALRLMSRFVHVASRKHALWKIGDIDVEGEFFDELVVKLGKEELGSKFVLDVEQLPQSLVPAARTVFLHTITRGSISEAELKENLDDGRPLIEIERICREIEIKSHYIHKEDGMYFYSLSETPLRMLEKMGEQLKEDEVRMHLSKRLGEIFGGEIFRVHVGEIAKVETSRPNLLIVLPNGEDPGIAEHRYRNVIFAMFPSDEGEIMRLASLELAGKKSRKKVVKQLVASISASLETQILTGFTQIHYSDRGKTRFTEVSFIPPTRSPQNMLRDQLISKHLLLDSLNPEYVDEISGGKEITIDELVELFARDARQRALLSRSVLEDCARKGSEQKLWDYRDGRLFRAEPEEQKLDLGMQTDFIDARKFADVKGRIAHDYSFTHTLPGNRGVTELFRTLGLLKLIDSRLDVDCKIELMGESGGRLKLEIIGTEVSDAYMGVKRILPSLKEFPAESTVLKLVVNDFKGATVDDKLIKALQGLHALGGEVFVTTS